MFCTKCGKEIKEGMKHCPFCGEIVKKGNTAKAAVSSNEKKKFEKNKDYSYHYCASSDWRIVQCGDGK